MKKVPILFALLLSFLFSNSQSVGIGTSTPDASALLELSSPNKGFLPPRVQLTSTNNPSPVANPAAGLLVYNTSISGSTPTNVKPGYYYWTGIEWSPLVNRGNVYGDMQYWNGSQWVMIPLGLNGQVLTICGGVPQWGNGTCQTMLTLQPANNPYELNYQSYNPNQVAGPGSQFAIQAWTAFGSPLNSREIIKFDFSTIPSNAVIDSAILYLYSSQSPAGGNTVDAQYGSSNALYIQRITSAWTLPCPYSWNFQPNVTTTNQVLIPQSQSSNQDERVYITNLVKDVVVSGNNGFQIKLQNEVTYNIRQYTSSFNADAAKRPKLVLYYH